MGIRHAKAPKPFAVRPSTKLGKWSDLLKSKTHDLSFHQSFLAKIRNEDLQTELEYFSEDYDEELEMEPRPERTREVTPPLHTRSPRARRQRERIVGFEEAPNKERSRIRRNVEAHLGRSKDDQLPRSSLTSVHGGRQFTINTGGNLPPNVHSIKQREGESVRAFTTRYIDDTLLILGLHEDQRIFGFVHGLKARNLVEHLSTDLPSTYKGLMEKTYTWIEAREVATNGALNDRRDNFERSRKSSWNNGIG
nr:hypothetical protein [Tanacetum cinerariifolium]